MSSQLDLLHHLTRRALLIATLMFLHAGLLLRAEQVTLAWDANAESDLVGYRLYYGTSAGVYDHTLDVGNVTTRTVPGLEPGSTYWFAATAYSSAGLESDFSNEVSYTVPGQGPTISQVSDRTIAEDASTGALGFTVGHPSIAAGSLTVTASSSNPALVPQANLVLGGSGSSRTVTATPAANASGSTTITLVVSDGSLTATTSFVLTVNPVNDAPAISNIADQSTSMNTARGPISFTIGDVETAAGSLTLAGGSSNPTLVPVSAIVFGGSGANRTVTVTPAANQTGTATITVTVGDGARTASDTFVLSVSAVNTAPTVSDIPNQTINEDSATAALAFTVGDAETAAGSLIVTAASSNTSLVPNGNILLEGSGASRTVTVGPAANRSGTATITVTASDGQLSGSDTFVLTVNAVNDRPTIGGIANRSISEDTVMGPVSFTVGDVDNNAGSLTVTASSSNTALVPQANLVVGGSDSSRTITATPVANASGSTTITLQVSDGLLTASRSFDLTVTAVNDAPLIGSVPDQTTVQDTAIGPIPFTVGDVETSAGSLTVVGVSDNLNLVPGAGIVLGGSGADRTVTITPAAGQSGTATVTLTVSDGQATASVQFRLTVDPLTLPPPWMSQDVGGPGLAGSASLQNGTFTVLGGGANIGGVADQFQYVWQTLSGDGEIRARVPSVEPTSTFAKAGVMIRETLNANSRHMLVCVSPDRGFQVVARVRTGGNSTLSQGGALNPGADNWIRIVRSGSSLRAYKSANGTSWTQIGKTIRMSMASQIRLGLAVTAGNNQQRCAATFDQVSVVP